jgi:hypothetical protein
VGRGGGRKELTPPRIRYKAWIDAPEGDKDIGGVPVYTAPVFLDMRMEDKPMLLTRNCTIGERLEMVDEWADGPQNARCALDRSIRAYCQDSDREFIITMGQALNACMRFDEEGRLNKTHHDLARHHQHRDMFLYQARSEATNRVVEFWGQIEEKNLERRTIDNVASSLHSLCSAEQRADIDGLVQEYWSLRDAKPIVTVPLSAYDSLSSTDTAQVSALEGDLSGLGSWFGLECLARDNRDLARQAKVKKGIAAFIHAYDMMNDRLGAGSSNNMALDAERCPAHLSHFVVHKGPAALFECAIAPFKNGSAQPAIPLYIGKSATIGLTTATAGDVSDRVAFFHATNSGTGGIQALISTVKSGDEPSDYVAIYERILEFLQYKRGDVEKETADSAKKMLSFAPLAFVHCIAKIKDGAKLATLLDRASKDIFGDDGTLMEGFQGSAWDAVPTAAVGAFITVCGTSAGYGNTSAVGVIDKSLRVDAVPGGGAQSSLRANEVSDFKLSPYVVHPHGSVAVSVLVTAAEETSFWTRLNFLRTAPATGFTMHMRFADYMTGYTTPRPTTVARYVDAADPYLSTKMHLSKRNMSYMRADGRVEFDNANMDDISRMTYAAEAIPIDDDLHFTNCPPFMSNYSDASGTSDPLKRACRMAIIFARVTLPVCRAMLANDMAIPYGFDIMRPFQEQEMEMAISMRGGPDTGKTYWGHSNVMFSQNAYAKTMFLHLSYYSKSNVHTADHIIKMPNVGYAGYFGGAGSQFFDMETAELLKNQDYVKTPEQRVEGFPSLYSFMRPAHRFAGCVKRAIDIRGSDGGEVTDKPHHPSAHFYRLHLNLDVLRSGGRPGYMAYEHRNTNSLVFQGNQEIWVPTAGNYGNRTWCDGHHGPNVQVGVRAVRAGKIVEMPSILLMHAH